MKTLLTVGILLMSSIITVTYGQGEGEDQNNHSTKLVKRIDPGSSTVGGSSSPQKTISAPEPKELTAPSDRVNNGTKVKLDKPVPATKSSSSVEISEIEYSLENNSTLTNLLNLIEIKEKVNLSTNPSLKSSNSYQVLTQDIETLRSDFDDYVESKGIENCSTTEQSHYLAFLKEEGNDKAYSKAIQKLK